jgi:polygalacturonase
MLGRLNRFGKLPLLSTVVPIVSLLGIFPGSGAVSSPAPTTSTSYPCTVVSGDVDVTTCGDTSGWNDRPVIQRANDVVAAAGGGRVLFPPGGYTAGRIIQDSNVQFVGTAGAAATSITRGTEDSWVPVIMSRTLDTYGSITAGSTTLRVRDATGIIPGVLVGIRGAGGASQSQRATLSTPVTAVATSFTIKDFDGLPRSGTNYLLIDNEIVSYAKITTSVVSGVKRGLLGTTATSHTMGTYAWQSQRFVAKVLSVSGTTVTLDAPAPRTVYEAATTVGTTGLAISGLKLVGSQSSSASSGVVIYSLTNGAHVSDSVITNGDQIGIRLLQGSRDSVIENNSISHNGDVLMSAGVWLYGGARDNIVRGNTFVEDFAAVAIDDRSTISTEWDGSANGNTIENNVMRVKRTTNKWWVNTGVMVMGSSDNVVRGNEITGPPPGDVSVPGPWYGIYVARAVGQGQVPVETLHNDVSDNLVRRAEWGLYISGSRNDFIANTLEAATRPVLDLGSSNYYESNVCTDASGETTSCT